MNLTHFKKLQKWWGTRVVWTNGGKKNPEYCFSLNEELEDNQEEHDKFVKACEGVEGIEIHIGRGDDIANTLSVTNLQNFNKVYGLEEFVNKYVGPNCYTDEE